jgi:uncharacterized membrane protein
VLVARESPLATVLEAGAVMAASAEAQQPVLAVCMELAGRATPRRRVLAELDKTEVT